jgi:LuxR family maltose regulon positive regulatory protein
MALVEVATVRTSLLMDRLQLEEVQRLAGWALHTLSPGSPGLYNSAEDLRPVILFQLGLAHRFAGKLPEAVPALREAAHSARPLGNMHIVALALGHLTGVQRQQGRLREAAATGSQGVEDVAAMAGHLSPMAAMLHAELGSLAYERNDLEEAGVRWRKAIELAQPWRNWEGLVPAYLGLARLARAQGESRVALAELAALEEMLAEHTELFASRLAAWRALLWAESGDVATAQHWRRKVDAALAAEPPLLQEETSLPLAYACLALGDVAAAEALATEQRGTAEAGERWGNVIPLLVVEAVVLTMAGRRELALSRLERALDLARPEPFVRAFVDAGPPLAPLLYELAAGDAAGEYAAALLALLPEAATAAPAPTGAPEAADGLIEPLSEREVEVLQLIARGQTNQEIAQRLHLAVGTVKVHAHNIYGKLQVGNRTEAVAQARRFGLLPPE